MSITAILTVGYLVYKSAQAQYQLPKTITPFQSTERQQRTLIIFCEFRGQTVRDLQAICISAPHLRHLTQKNNLQITLDDLVTQNLLRFRDNRYTMTKAGLDFVLKS